jgi:hypothetical protein
MTEHDRSGEMMDRWLAALTVFKATREEEPAPGTHLAI